RQEIAARQTIAKRVLGDLIEEFEQNACHIFLHLPEPWRSDDFVAQAKSKNVLVNGAEIFAVGRTVVPHAVRICLGSAQNRNQVQTGLEVIKGILSDSPRPSEMII